MTARVVDRALRPCFPDGYLCETHIVATVMSYDGINHPAPLALIGASTALMISDIPFNGPIASMRLGMKEGKILVNPEIGETGDLDLNVAARPGAILMVEAGANFLTEEQMLDAMQEAHRLMEPIYEFQLQVQREIGKKKRVVEPHKFDPATYECIQGAVGAQMASAFAIREKLERRDALNELRSIAITALGHEATADQLKAVSPILEDLKYKYVRNLAIQTKKRIDGRSLTDIRPILCEVGVLKRPHGSALFQRGETQSLSTVTLGAGTDDEQRIDSILRPDATKRFMLHYNFPPYSVGEARPLRAPGRREIGHGNLAERALEPVIPSAEKFGYTIRLVSEVLESNGSSSMATVCAGTMALLHAGVPLIEPVAGIAMGLIKEGSDYVVLSDILGDEDHLGDMDFKVCGNARGITALQMDIKIDGLSPEIMRKALAQALEGRKHILAKITDCVNSPSNVSEFAPQIFNLKVSTNKIRDLIGPGGKNIKKLVSETGVKIDISDDGMVNIISPTASAAEAAKAKIRMITADPEIGGIYLGQVKRIMDFGAIVEIKPGSDGLCHISQLDNKRVERVEDVVKEGEEILVKIIDIDRQGKIKLSRKDALGKKPSTTP